MAHAGDVIKNPVTGQRLIFLITSADSDGELFAAEGVFPPGGFTGVSHIHPHQDEHFEVLAGHAAFDIDGTRHVLGAGDTVNVPGGTKHTFSNAGQDEMRVRFEFRPALAGTDRFYELYFAFAQHGRVNAEAMPGLLDIATVWPITSEHAVLATPPPVIQHALFRVLAPIARIAKRQPPVCRSTPTHTEQPLGDRS